LPIAVVEQELLQGKKVVSGSLSDITQKVDKKKLQSPSLIIIGDVVRLRKKLNWFS
jgi:uroporphyrin-III C-methyltransferase / precorrin-2 dehydrogenase / sirohydrochlorin ferrochelatase